jgi:hypothetical protein
VKTRTPRESGVGRFLSGRRRRGFRRPLGLGSGLPLPFLLFLLLLGEISLSLCERIVRFGHPGSFAIGFELEEKVKNKSFRVGSFDASLQTSAGEARKP